MAQQYRHGFKYFAHTRDLVAEVIAALEQSNGATKQDLYVDKGKRAYRIKLRGHYNVGADPDPKEYGFDVDADGKPYTPARILEYLYMRLWEELDAELEAHKVHPWDRRRVSVGTTKASYMLGGRQVRNPVCYIAIWVARSADD